MNTKSDHEKFKEWVQLSLYDELNSEEKNLLNEHLSGCPGCMKEYKELQKLHSLLKNEAAFSFDEETLLEARRELKAAIRIENSRPGFLAKTVEAVKNFFFFNYKVALGGAVVLILGIALGYFFRNPGTQPLPEQPSEIKNISSNDPLAQQNIRIDNLRIQDSDPSNGNISLTFDAVKQVKMKGKINDLMVQRVLAHALTNEQNDGVRLRTINAIASQTEQDKQPDPKIKSALISALKHDQNPGVRREALIVLNRFQMDSDIKEAFLYVLTKDTNSGLRIAAINSLTPDRLQEKEIDQNLINILKQKSQTDDNEYIRIRAKSVLQEVVQQ